MRTRAGVAGLLLLLCTQAGWAQQQPRRDGPQAQAAGPGAEHLAKGDYYFKAGYYLKASEHYRLALLEDPTSPWKKLAFGHALFAIGNYSYASYALRRGVNQLEQEAAFRPEIEPLFASKRAFVQAMRDLKKYVTYSPRDPAGLTVLGYVLFSVPGEERRCRDMFLYLKRLDRNDPFAAYFLKQLEARGTRGDTPSTELPDLGPLDGGESKPEDESEDEDPAPAPAPAPREPLAVEKPAPSLEKVVSEPARQGERAPESEWPEPVPAQAE
jgi:tetratricopeptide (TPR) repeat protein